MRKKISSQFLIIEFGKQKQELFAIFEFSMEILFYKSLDKMKKVFSFDFPVL